MIKAKTSVVKNQLSRFLAEVRRGETVCILDRDTPVALLVPVATAAGEGGADGGDAVLLAQLERKGLVRRGAGGIDEAILATDPPGRPAGVLQALLEERERR
jgi:antitoxin (DNA-binding transcriptional repressor) of toxin-antitoxin stability system